MCVCVCVCVTFLICSMGAICPQNLFCWSMLVKAFSRNPPPPMYLYISNWNLSFFFFSLTSSPISPGCMCLFPIEIGRLMGLGSRRIECRKLFYRMPFRVAFLWPSWKCSCWNSRGASFALRLPCHLLLISIPLKHLLYWWVALDLGLVHTQWGRPF